MAKPTCLLAFIRVPEVVTCSQVAGLCHAQVLHDSGPPASEVFSNSFFRFSRGKAPLQHTARFVLTSLGQAGVLFHRFTLLGAPYQNGTLQTPLATPSGFSGLSIALVCACTVPPLLQKTLLSSRTFTNLTQCPSFLHLLLAPSSAGPVPSPDQLTFSMDASLSP